ncbi:MAG: MarR family winged helix-turn-helix transcriptional regulator [Acholeplasma sp.]|nr:MarR family winged helix-turn-helix transcriptional regulator [Acholeplasma sp.]
MQNHENKFIKTLLEIYNLEIINEFMKFLQGELAVLFALKHNQDNHASKIGKHLNITKSRMSSIIKSLIRKNLISVDVDQNDKRLNNLILTSKGFDLINASELRTQLILKEFFTHMTKDEIDTLTSLLGKVTSFMKGVEQNGND